MAKVAVEFTTDNVSFEDNPYEELEYVISIGKYGSISEFIAGWCNSPISTLKNAQLLT